MRILMVDGQFAPLSDKIKAAIKAISPLPIKYLVNTHFHGDHTGGNANFAKDGVTVVAHDNIRVRLCGRNGVGSRPAQRSPPRPAEACRRRPISAVRSRSTSAAARQKLDRISRTRTPTATRGSTSADANVLCTGDTANNLRRYQNIDYRNGGDVRGMIRALDTYIKACERPDQDRRRSRQARHDART